MNTSYQQSSGRLRGKCLFMSANVPEIERSESYPRVEDAHQKIDEAIISLARAVFFEEGSLVFSDRPSNTLLVATIAGEYREPRFAEGEESQERESGNAIVYQSSFYASDLPDETQILESFGYLTVRLTDDENLFLMRRRMIEESQPIAMVCIGGMEDVQEEINLFQEIMSESPIYAMATTGGAAEVIVEDEQNSIRAIDLEIMEQLEPRRRELRLRNELEEEFEFRYTPYALIMQKIIDDLLNQF